MLWLVVILLICALAGLSGFFAWRNIRIPGYRYLLIVVSGLIWAFFLFSGPQESILSLSLPVSELPEILPSASFLLDSISKPFLHGLAAVLVYSTLNFKLDLREISWIMLLIGASMLGVISGDVFTLLLSWTLIDLGWLYFRLRDQKIGQENRDWVLVFMLRLIGPGILISLGLVGYQEHLNWSFLEIQPQSALLLASGSFFRWGVWFPLSDRRSTEKSGNGISLLLGLLPGAVSAVILTRAAGLELSFQLSTVVSLLPGVLLLLICGYWYLLAPGVFRWKLWSLGIYLGIFSAVIHQNQGAVLFLGLILILSGSLWLLLPSGSVIGWTVLGSYLVSSLILPIVTSGGGWLFHRPGLVGTITGTGMGLLLVLPGILVIKKMSANKSLNLRPALILPGLLTILISQLAGFLQMRLFFNGFSDPIFFWQYGMILILGGALLYWTGRQELPEKQYRFEDQILRIFAGIIYRISNVFHSVIQLGASLLEGRAGLIWTLIIGFLILTLMNIQGIR